MLFCVLLCFGALFWIYPILEEQAGGPGWDRIGKRLKPDAIRVFVVGLMGMIVTLFANKKTRLRIQSELGALFACGYRHVSCYKLRYICVLFVVGITWRGYLYYSDETERWERSFRPIAARCDDIRLVVNPSESPYIRGRAIVLRIQDYRVHDVLYESLPPELRAANASDTSTVIFANDLIKYLGDYHGIIHIGTSGGSSHWSAYQRIYYITIIDTVQRKRVFEKSFYGPLPPSTISSEDEGYGPYPYPDILAFISRLPHK